MNTWLSRRINSFCSACREELALKKSTITNHNGGVKHKKSKEALEKRQAREQDIATFLSVYDEEVEPKGSASVSMDTRVYRVRVVGGGRTPEVLKPPLTPTLN